MLENCVIAEFADVASARLGLEVLAKSGYGEEHVSVVTRSGTSQDDSQTSEITEGDVERLEKSTNDAKGLPEGIGIGGLLGTTLAIPLAASTLIGPFIILGPVVGAGIGAALGGMLGSASDKEDEISRYRQSLEAGGILVVVIGDKGELLDVEASIKTAGPTRVTRFSSN